jgi:hypothetical protein
MEQAGVPRSVAMKLTGDKTENVYGRYAIVSEADLDSAAVRLAEAASRFVSRSAAPALKYCSAASRLRWLPASDLNRRPLNYEPFPIGPHIQRATNNTS